MGHSDQAEIGKTYYGRTDAKSATYMTRVVF